MPLPKLNTPTYELTLPSSNRKVKYRPFLVKEEKILLIAMETEDEKEMQNAVKQILKNCILTRGISVDKLAVFDIEYLFLNIRGKSVGEEITLNIVCPDDETTEVEVAVNVEDVKIQKSDKHNTVIQLNDKVGIVMKYPSMEMFVKNNITGDPDQQKVDTIFDMTIDCISQVVEGEDVLESKSFSKKEMLEFVETFDTQQFQKIQDFFETMPKLSHKIEVTNPNTKVKSEVVIEGLSSFFD
tara:strand:+ start:11717 stop:12439 length:723 start_codon:yes stop_codon:yes gene_type:complete